MSTDTHADSREVVLLDTSAAVALVVEDHEAHVATRDAIRGRRLGLAGHAWFETFSVLTRLPAGLRRSPAVVFRLLARDFPESGFLGQTEAANLREELSGLGISGGAVYDALVAAAARQHHRRLVTADTRAIATYKALDVEIELIR